MTKEQLLAEIKFLLFNEYVDPSFRIEVEDKLDKLSEEKLREWYEALREKIVTMRSLEMFVHDVEKASAKVTDPAERYQRRVKQHPLFSLRLPRVVEMLKSHSLDYIRRGVSLRDEYELYLTSQRDIASREGENIEVYTVAQVRQAFLDGITGCIQTLRLAQGTVPVAQFLARYDSDFDPTKTDRAAFERTKLIDEMKIASDDKEVARQLLDSYDHILFEDAILASDDAEKIVQQIVKESTKVSKIDEVDLDKNLEGYVVPKKLTPDIQPVKSTIQAKKESGNVEIAITSNVVSSSRLQSDDILKILQQWRSQRFGSSDVLEQLYSAVLQKRILECVAGLKFLATSGQLFIIIEDNKLSKLLVGSYKNNESVEEGGDLTNGKDPINNFRLLMKLILIQKLNLSDSDAAQLVSELVGIARDKGEKIDHVSYYDEADGQYHWL